MKKMILVMMAAMLAVTLGACRRTDSAIERVRIDDADAVFLEQGTIRITRGELFNRLLALDTQRLNSEGTNFLFDMIDETLLADRIAAIDADRVEEEWLLLRYGTTDSEEIETIEANELQSKHARENFELSVLRYGVDPTDDEAIDAFIRLNLARRDIALDHIVDSIDPDRLPHDLRHHYSLANRGDITAIALVYPTAQAALEAFQAHNLVFLFDGGIGRYIGEEPIENLRFGDFDETNTEALTDEEVFSYFITLYNERYPYREALEPSMTLEEAELDASYFQFDYRTLASSDRTARLANILFSELSAEPGSRYTNEPRRVHLTDARLSRYRVLYFVVDQETLTPFEDLDEEAYDALVKEFAESRYNAAVEVEAMIRYRHEHGLVLHDDFLHRSYSEIVNHLTNGQADVYAPFEPKDGYHIASLGDNTIGTDVHYDYMLERIGAQVVVEMAKEAWLHQSDYFKLLYGEPRDVRLNDHPDIVRLFGDLDQLRDEQGDDFDYFIAKEFGRVSDIDLLLYVLLWDVANHTIPDYLDIARALEFAEERRDEYFRLYVEHLLIYVDFEDDFSPDDYDRFLEGLSPESREAHEALVADFVDEIMSLHDEGVRFDLIARSYLDASHDDATWGRFKQAGLILRHENLTRNNPMRSEDIRFYVDPFRDRLRAIYAAYTSDYEDQEILLDPFLEEEGAVSTRFGQHIILTRRPTDDFTPPSARFEADDDYLEGWVNDDDLPTADQLTLWLDYQFTTIFLGEDADFDIPEALDDALAFYFDAYLGRVFPSLQHDMDPFNRRLTIERFWADDVQFLDQNTALQYWLTVLHNHHNALLD